MLGTVRGSTQHRCSSSLFCCDPAGRQRFAPGSVSCTGRSRAYPERRALSAGRVAAELRGSEDSVAERLRAARNLLAAYDPVRSTWFEDPDAVTPGKYLTLSATPKEVRNSYRRMGARFEVDSAGESVLRLELDLGVVALQSASSN